MTLGIKYIVVKSDYFSEGLFGQILTWLIEILPTLIKHDIYPKFIIRSRNYGLKELDYNIIPNTIEYNYEPKKTQLPNELKKYMIGLNKNEYILSFEKIKHEISSKYFNPNFAEVNTNFNKFFKIPKHILNNVNALINNNKENKDNKDNKDNNNILGIHYRGTDKLVDDIQNKDNVSNKDFFDIIDKLIIKNDYKVIYLATDSSKMYDLFTNKYNDIKVISLNMNRFNSTNHGVSFRVKNNQLTNSTNAMIDSICLSKCKELILTNSALSAWSKIFNPKLKAYRLNTFPQNWFPVHYIPKVDKSFFKD